MGDYEKLMERLAIMEYHQKLLIKLIRDPKLEFYRLIVEKGISEAEVQKFYQKCDQLTIKLTEQKAEGFVYFQPLFEEFSTSLPGKLNIHEAIRACLTQKLYEPLFEELKRYL